MIPRPDLLRGDAPSGLEVFQITQGAVPSSHLYMEAPIFTPDSKRFLLHESAHPQGANSKDPQHRFLICDLDNGGALQPLTDELYTWAPALSPDGVWCCYFVDETELDGGRLTLRKRRLGGTEAETLCVVDAPVPPLKHQPSRPYLLSTIRSDGRKLATAAFFGDGRRETVDYGLMVFDLEDGAVEVVLHGPTWCNLHPQYCRSRDPQCMRDIMVQENHNNQVAEDGKIIVTSDQIGADIHCIRDDGLDLRSFPWGRDGCERIQGHQCWRGRSHTAIGSTGRSDDRGWELIESPPAPFAQHVGANHPEGRRNILTRSRPDTYVHFAVDDAGGRLVTDSRHGHNWGLHVARFANEPDAPLEDWQHLLNTNGSDDNDAHPHPFLSPDGRRAFFNSNETGVPHAYMIQGFD